MECRWKTPCPIFLVVLVLLMSRSSSAEKVLLVPPPVIDSHWFQLAKIGRALVDRGHIVTAIVSQDIVHKRRSKTPGIQFETFDDKGTRSQIQEVLNHHMAKAETVSVYQYIRAYLNASRSVTEHCDLLLGGRSLEGRLKKAKYSVVLSDPLFPCGAILAALLGAQVPHIYVTREDDFFHDTVATGVPMPLSYVTSTELDLTDRMTLSERIQNVVFYSVVPMLRRWAMANTYGGLVRKYLGREETTQSVMSRTDLWLYQQDHLLDFPRPFMPNMVQVGGLMVREVDSLPKDMEDFMKSSGEYGVIIVSFGTMTNTMSPEKAKSFAAAFARLRQKVVWRHVGEKPVGLGNNTKILDWLPQNDLLGHPKTRAFITHAGYNGVQEALHHGVPMVCLPLSGDQPGNAARVVARGLGVKLDISTVTEEQLYQAVLHVLTDNRYRETAARLSRLHRDQPQSPMQRAVWWIEHIIRHGRLPHLRARAVYLPFYQYYLLDVAAVLLAVCSAVLGTVWCSCSLMCRKCCAIRRRQTQVRLDHVKSV